MIGFVALALASAAPAPAAPPSCIAEQGCARTDAAQLFALADKLYAAGDVQGAAVILQALTLDKHPELRAEARFRLAALREKAGDLRGAAQALNALLAEQPNANRARLELGRILARMGDAAASRAQFARAQAGGLPPDVAQTARRFASGLRSDRRRGGSIEVVAGPDSNVNRSTASPFVDTIIAPFDLDADARQQSALGFGFSLRGYSRDRVGGISLLSNAGVRADLSTKPQFNDIQFALDSGPEAKLGTVRVRPSALLERRWYGVTPYSTGVGGQLELIAGIGLAIGIGITGSAVHQKIDRNHGQDGWRTAVSGDVTRSLGSGVTVRGSVRWGALDARIRAESLRQLGAGLLVVREGRAMTLFGAVDYSRTRGLEPLFLFGKTRHDARWDLVAGAVFGHSSIAGFAPLVRLTQSDSSANIALYDYRRTRLDVGISRSF
ncbi:MAG: surface lipoprotein assembly modifier [Sphingomicrobium sp.]